MCFTLKVCTRTHCILSTLYLKTISNLSNASNQLTQMLNPCNLRYLYVELITAYSLYAK